MKKTVTLLAAALIACGAMAQKVKETEVPDAVKESFKKLHPDAGVKKWEKEKGNFEAEFIMEKTEVSQLFSAAGQLLETETGIGISQLPGGVREYVSKNLGGKKIREASKITDAKNVTTYEAEIGEADYIFDANGTFIKKETEDAGAG